MIPQSDDSSSQRRVSRLRSRAEKRSARTNEARAEKNVVDRESALKRSNAHPDSFLAHLNLKPIWFFSAFAALVAVLLLPLEGGLTPAGQVALAVLAFAVIMWVTEAVSYTVSSTLIIGLIAIILGFTPGTGLEGEADPVGTSNALGYALAGFSSSAVALVAAALALAAAMQATGLHKRLALWVLKLSGEKTSHVLIGAIVISIVLAFFVPSATARAGAVVPILLGMVAAFGLAKNSRLGALLVIAAAQSVSIWNIGIKTAAAQNLVAVGFISESMGIEVSWGQWFI